MNVTNYLRFLKYFLRGRGFVYIHYGVTHRCHLRCRMCSVWKRGDREKELSLPEIKSLAQGLRSLGAISVALGGGEPFMREDLPKIVRTFRDEGLWVRIVTNGVKPTPEDIRAVVQAGLTSVSISLDSLSPETQDFIRCSKNTLPEIMRSLNLFRELLPQKGRGLLLNTVVSRLNLKELPEIARFARNRGYLASFIPVVLAPAPDIQDPFAAHAPGMAIRKEDHPIVDEVYKRLKEMKRTSYPILNSLKFLEASRIYLKTGKVDWNCDAGRFYLSVSPEGKISICHRFDYPEMKASPELRKLMHIPQYQKQRQELISDCPGCIRPCWIETSLMMKDWRILYHVLRLSMRS